MRAMPIVDRLHEEFGEQVKFVRFNVDDPRSDDAKRLYRFRAQPQIVMLDANGTIAVSRVSGLTYLQLKEDLQSLL